MKHCPECEFTFDDQQQFCDFDGTELSVVPERLPSFKNASLAPSASASFLGHVAKSRITLAVLVLSGVAISALLIGYYDSVNQRNIDISKAQSRSDTTSAFKSAQADTVGRVETQADRRRIVSTQRKIGADELPPSTVKRLTGGSYSQPVRSRRNLSRSSLLASKRKAEHANRQSRARNQARPDSREQVRQQHSAGWMTSRREVVYDNENTHPRKDSKVVAILKKTGKILKRPFEFIAGR